MILWTQILIGAAGIVVRQAYSGSNYSNISKNIVSWPGALNMHFLKCGIKIIDGYFNKRQVS